MQNVGYLDNHDHSHDHGDHDHAHDHHDHEHGEHSHEHNHRREVLQGWAKTGLLLGLGIYFAYNIISGDITNYINERFTWLSYVTAALFLLLGVVSAVEMLRNGGHEHEHSHDGHTHSPISWKVIGLMAVPLVLGTLVPSKPLGSSAVSGNISMSAVSVTSATTFTSDPSQWNVLDWLRMFNQTNDPSSFTGKQADVIGFVYREPTFAQNQFMVARFAISCCVADASAIGLPVTWDKAQNFTQDTWVEVKGPFQMGSFRNDTVPVLMASSVTQVDQPAHPYLYP